MTILTMCVGKADYLKGNALDGPNEANVGGLKAKKQI